MKKRLKIIFALTVTVSALFLFITVFVKAVWYLPETEVPLSSIPPVASSTVQTPPEPDQYPLRLQIPALKIDAAVQYVGVNAKGNMAVPNNFTDVGWYKYGPVPGQTGSAVMAGHVNNGLGLGGVFQNLDKLKPGDEIFVISKNGKRLRFIMERAESYPYEAAPTEEIFSKNDGVRLNLITCIGTWLAQSKTYNKRLVVFAKLQPL